MKKITLKASLYALLLSMALVLSFSCKKEQAKDELDDSEIIKVDQASTKLQKSFAQILSKALASDQSIRDFIKKESLKQFDHDYDVFYPIIKDSSVDGVSFREKLLKFTNEDELKSIEEGLPLLTIFVPTVPDFSPESWNIVNEIPFVAVTSKDEDNDVYLFDEKGLAVTLKKNQIPGCPVVVIKENERINKKSTSPVSNYQSLNVVSNKVSDNRLFSFTDEAFNNMNAKRVKNVNSNVSSAQNDISIKRVVSGNVIDPINIQAYNSGVEWHRDHVYYGLTPTNQNGAYRNNFSEFITSFKFLTPNALSIIADQDGDPRVNNRYKEGSSFGAYPSSMWTEGNFEIRIVILINSKNGLGTEVTKTMSVRADQLFGLNYEQIGYNAITRSRLYELRSVVCREFNPNIEILPWDLQNYGTAWKFILYEIDNSQETTSTVEHTSQYAFNFSVDPVDGILKKIGLKFGGSAQTTEKNTFTVKTTLTSDYLGDATLTFDQPVIIGHNPAIGEYTTREITGGNLFSMSIEPKRVF